MNLINPFEETVVFGKAYPVAWPVERAQTLAALVPTGRHVSHANALSVTRNPRGGGGRATRLERYGRRKVSKGSVAQGLSMAGGAKGVMPLRNPAGTAAPGGALTRALKRRNVPVNSSLPTASKSGSRLR